MLASWREVQAMTVDKTTPNLAEIIAQKQRADLVIPTLTELLYPEDDDGR